MTRTQRSGKLKLAKHLGIPISTLYYIPRKTKTDWQLKCRIEDVMREYPSYGSRNLASALGYNRKRIRRIMRLFGLHPYRRRGKKWRKSRDIDHVYDNLLHITMPMYPHHVWVADFTELSFQDHKVYVATVLDIFTRQVVGVSVAKRKGAPLTVQALWNALLSHPRPEIFHSDNGREYEATSFIGVLEQCGISISRSRPGCPWENGYQESFYGKFKLDLGDPNRFETLGELVAEIYRTIWVYNHTRIHSALKMPPVIFAHKQKTALSLAT